MLGFSKIPKRKLIRSVVGNKKFIKFLATSENS
jgi:hypothetical protein